MNRLVKFGWFLTGLLFLVVLLWVYAYMPKMVSIETGTGGVSSYLISRENIFYLSLAIFAFVNAILFSFRKLIVLNQNGRGSVETPGKSRVKEDLAVWALGFAAALNIFFVFGILYMGFFSNPEGRNFAHYAPVVYAGPVLIGILLIILVYILLKKRD